MQPRFWRGEKKSIRIIFQTFVRTKHTKHFVDLVVVRFYVFIADWPVITKSINAFAFKIFGAKAKRNSSQ